MLQGKKRDQIRTLEHGDLIDMAGWEKNMTNEFPDTNVLHWHHQNPEWTCASKHGVGDAGGHVRCDGHGAESGSLFCALAYFFDSFASAKVLQHYPEPAEPIDTPTTLSALSNVPKDKLEAGGYLRWMGILIGDLHQPLHWLRQHDYGREVSVVYKDHKYTLLDFWEDYLPTQLAAAPEKADLQKKYAELSPKWQHHVPPELFRQWAHEVAERVCVEVYSQMEENHADGSRSIAPEFHLSDELFAKWKATAEELTVLAGLRLGFVLTDILEHRRHKHALKQGRGLIHHMMLRRHRWRDNLMKNSAIAIVVVPSLLSVFHLHEKGILQFGKKVATAMV
jgi:hypothetical protein